MQHLPSGVLPYSMNTAFRTVFERKDSLQRDLEKGGGKEKPNGTEPMCYLHK